MQLAMLLRGGYIPYPYIIAILPFSALLISGVADALWPARDWWHQGWYWCSLSAMDIVVVFSMTLTFVAQGSPSRPTTLHTEFKTNQAASQKQVLDWVQYHLSHNMRLVTEGELCPNLRMRCFSNPEVTWTYKVDTDPAVCAKYGNSIAGLDYLVIYKGAIDQSANSYPILHAAIIGTTILAHFGTPGSNQILVLKLHKPS